MIYSAGFHMSTHFYLHTISDTQRFSTMNLGCIYRWNFMDCYGEIIDRFDT